MKTIGGKTPAVTQSSTLESQNEAEGQKAQIEPSSRKDQAGLKAICLERDDYCCVATGFVDIKWADTHPADYPWGTPVEKTECAHILPFSLGKFDDNSTLDVTNKAIIWAALFRYFPALQGLIRAETINIPENAITLSSPLHSYFGEFEFSFEQSVFI